MAIGGADFLDIYRYFLDRTGDENRAYDAAWRVFRGAPLRGGYPLTKDIVYLDGLLRVHSFLRSTVSTALGRGNRARGGPVRRGATSRRRRCSLCFFMCFQAAFLPRVFVDSARDRQ